MKTGTRKQTHIYAERADEIYKDPHANLLARIESFRDLLIKMQRAFQGLPISARIRTRTDRLLQICDRDEGDEGWTVGGTNYTAILGGITRIESEALNYMEIMGIKKFSGCTGATIRETEFNGRDLLYSKTADGPYLIMGFKLSNRNGSFSLYYEMVPRAKRTGCKRFLKQRMGKDVKEENIKFRDN
ncbi:MAG: hypothetical protein NT076_01490 [Candidatus Pacearchaeota archaeon]|nr:hypothetical protein [Candidatus Pacearchaeota archaeon]